MQSLPVKALKDLARCRSQASGSCPKTGAVDRIADHGMTGVRHVHADLVRATRFELEREQAGDRFPINPSELLDCLEVSDCVASSFGMGYCNSGSVGAAAAERRFYGPARAARRSPHQGQVAPLETAIDTVALELGRKPLVRGIRLGHNEQPGRILVEAMHDAWPADSADAG